MTIGEKIINYLNKTNFVGQFNKLYMNSKTYDELCNEYTPPGMNTIALSSFVLEHQMSEHLSESKDLEIIIHSSLKDGEFRLEK